MRAAILLLSNVGAVLCKSSILDKDLSYTRYPKYPPYCSVPEDMEKRGVPPLQSSDLKTKLVHVTSVIRHGARTPWSDQMMCWDGYWQDPELGIWNCDLTTMISPPSAPFVTEVENDPTKVNDEIGAESGSSSMFLFEKRYDALNHPPHLTNLLNGTCQKGQLLLKGYEQEMANGRHLREAYVHDGLPSSSGPASTDDRMRLFDLTGDDDGSASLGGRKPYEEPNLRYRADDEQRTMMSGQVLLRGMWGDIIAKDSAETGENPVIIVHTGDYSVDVLAPRESNCPRLSELREEAEQSETFQTFNTSEEANILRTLMVEELGNDFTDNIHDCLMTTMCTDRKLPDILADYGSPNDGGGKYGGNIFQRLIDYNTFSWCYNLAHNDGAYSKLGMGPLWYEIMSNIKPFLNGDDSEPLTKMALISGHDSTVEPLLASLGNSIYDGTVWVPYATMFNIEIHESTNSQDEKSHFFRLILNGDAITSRVPGCPDDNDLCDVSVLVDIVEPFARYDPDCATRSPADEAGQNSIKTAEAAMSTPSALAILFVTIFFSSILGGVTTYVYLTRQFPFCGHNNYRRGSSGIALDNRKGTFTSVEDAEHHEKGVDEADGKRTSYGAAEHDSHT
eukprot:CAMPEP_0185738278 /NCGR_PEP_ID=MMETSP1171-20130828/32455_1 /TAXON_ID=374046 /ORGANISM="Helicotheca tamensis, Strain CCMP826" /LENGTH=619 /DNA_ID=CAMNT_0028409445 /DNA_START=55 /DNA_END=1911 /DNA_ORIENTATION=-